MVLVDYRCIIKRFDMIDGLNGQASPTVFTMKSFAPVCAVHPPKKRGDPPIMVLTDECILEWEKNGHILQHIFHVGFKSDGATVPRAMWGICPPIGMYLAAAFLHDEYCYEAIKKSNYRVRAYGDKLFYSWLKQCGVKSWRAWPMSKSVIMYGKWLKITGKFK